MKRSLIFTLALIGSYALVHAQSIEKKWAFSQITKNEESIFNIYEDDLLTLENGTFTYRLSAKKLEAAGNYTLENNTLTFYYSKPSDTVRTYTITELTNTALVFTGHNVFYGFKALESPSDEAGDKADIKINYWQLHENLTYENFPDGKARPSGFLKGKEYITLEQNGAYTAIINNLRTTGYWIQNNNLLILKQKNPIVIDAYYEIIEASEDALKLKNGNNVLHFISESNLAYVAKAATSDEIIPNQGFSVNSLWRGALGMFTLLVIAFLFSSNRRKINWKTVGIGLGAQLLLAIGVLKVPFIQRAFEAVGSIFVLILDFTRSGSEFLLGGMMNVDSYGFIFLFQVLPTIVFFSALTSVLFYLGVIQIVVKGMAWVLTKLMGISGGGSPFL